MSYILDALKKADAERGLGAASDPLPLAWAPAPKSDFHMPLLWGGGLTSLLLALGVAALYAWPMEEDDVNEATIAVPLAGSAAPITPLANAPAPEATAPEADQMPAPVIAPPVAPAVAVRPSPPPMVQGAAQHDDAGDTLVAQAASSSIPPESQLEQPDEAVPSEPDQPDPIPSLPAGLPPQNILRRVPLPPAPSAMPAKAPPVSVRPVPTPVPVAKPSAPPAAPSNGRSDIVISGSSYSTNPEHRMLIANGKVVKEGQELSPGLKLESIGPRTAVFNQGGSRFNVNY